MKATAATGAAAGAAAVAAAEAAAEEAKARSEQQAGVTAAADIIKITGEGHPRECQSIKQATRSEQKSSGNKQDTINNNSNRVIKQHVVL